MSSRASPDHSILTAFLKLRPIYIFSFIGSAAGIPFPAASLGVGVALCIFFACMVSRGYIRKNPVVSSCVLFLLLTAIGVAGIRSDLGLVQSVSSRYTFFSMLFLVCTWIAIVEEFVMPLKTSLINSGIYVTVLGCTILFSLFMDGVGWMIIKKWDSELLAGMTAFEHPDPPDSTDGPDMPSWKSDPKLAPFNATARAILFESIRLGVYTPPRL